jgi:predicted protein tyrosine phosphatase
MYEVLPGLWLGDERDSQHHDSCIRSVLNCTSDIPFRADDLELPRARLKVEDNGDPCQMVIMARELPSVLAWLRRVMQSSRPLLVHCRMGRQRSACVVAAHLMQSQNLSAKDAINRVKSMKRDAFFPFPNFRSSLSVYAEWLRKNDPTYTR